MTLISQAGTIIVYSLNNGGQGSLRLASSVAQSGDTIRFNPNLLTAGVDSISLATEIDFDNRGIVIKGLYTATDTLFISGANSSRIFSFNAAGKVVLDSLVLINGNAGSFGGAVYYVYGTDTLFVSNSTFSENAAGAFGGGVYSSSVTVTNSTFNGNTSGASGAGIYASSSSSSVTVTVTNSTFSENAAGAFGGGIYAYSSSSSVTVTNSTFNGNTSGASGGGVCSSSYSSSSSSSSSVTVTNSTFIGNMAGANGGGLFSDSFSSSSSSSVTVTNSTFSGNTAAANGGGLFSDSYSSSSSSSSVTLGSSIFDESSIFNNPTNAIISSGYNIFSDDPAGANGTGDITNSTVLLQPLAFNGGATQTMLPDAGSVAIDAGNPNDMTDAQNRSISGGIRDVGAAETTCMTSGTQNETACFGGSIVVNGTTYDASNLTGTEVFTNAGTNNCDSTVTVTLTIENTIDVSTTTSGLTITANATGATYNWIDCNTGNSIAPAETGINYTATANGDYAVVVTVGNCSDTSACVNVNTVGVNDHNNLTDNITIYPNPATNKLTIENENLKINSTLIVNISGKIVKEITTNTDTIDVSNLIKGIYFLQIQTDNGSVIKKFIKE